MEKSISEEKILEWCFESSTDEPQCSEHNLANRTFHLIDFELVIQTCIFPCLTIIQVQEEAKAGLVELQLQQVLHKSGPNLGK